MDSSIPVIYPQTSSGTAGVEEFELSRSSDLARRQYTLLPARSRAWWGISNSPWGARPLRPSRALADPIAPAKIVVTDGDTIQIGVRSYRLIGFDTRETSRALCASEHAKDTPQPPHCGV